jgi:hypothetical protein
MLDDEEFLSIFMLDDEEFLSIFMGPAFSTFPEESLDLSFSELPFFFPVSSRTTFFQYPKRSVATA